MNDDKEATAQALFTANVIGTLAPLGDLKRDLLQSDDLTRSQAFDAGVKGALNHVQEAFHLIPKMTTDDAGELVERAVPADSFTESLASFWDEIAN